MHCGKKFQKICEKNISSKKNIFKKETERKKKIYKNLTTSKKSRPAPPKKNLLSSKLFFITKMINLLYLTLFNMHQKHYLIYERQSQ
jgi:hypothetical protein